MRRGILITLQLLVEQLNYAHLSTYVYKAETALESTAVSSSLTKDATTGESDILTQRMKLPQRKTTSVASSPERDLAQTMIDLAAALSHLGQKHYEKAALGFTRLCKPDKLGD